MKRSYRCSECGKVMKRDSDKAKVKSYCSFSDKDVFLILVKESER